MTRNQTCIRCYDNQDKVHEVGVAIYHQNGNTPYKVIQLDTQDDIGNIRVYINDRLIFSGDPEKGEAGLDNLVSEP